VSTEPAGGEGADGASTDARLVEQVQRGDKHAFDMLVRKYQHKIYSLVGRFLRDQPDDVPDVVQEAFIKAYRALPRFRGDSAFYTWLYRIAVNTSKNHLVSRSRRPPDVDVELEDAEAVGAGAGLRELASPERLRARDELEAVIHRTIDGLPDDLRTALTLREFEGLSYEDIANVMDCPVGTVRSRIFRAREAVDTAIRPLIHDGP
jgi:RNA polymerase sigma-70 factor (ECF subfamily)